MILPVQQNYIFQWHLTLVNAWTWHTAKNHTKWNNRTNKKINEFTDGARNSVSCGAIETVVASRAGFCVIHTLPGTRCTRWAIQACACGEIEIFALAITKFSHCLILSSKLQYKGAGKERNFKTCCNSLQASNHGGLSYFMYKRSKSNICVHQKKKGRKMSRQSNPMCITSSFT